MTYENATETACVLATGASIPSPVQPLVYVPPVQLESVASAGPAIYTIEEEEADFVGACRAHLAQIMSDPENE